MSSQPGWWGFADSGADGPHAVLFYFVLLLPLGDEYAFSLVICLLRDEDISLQRLVQLQRISSRWYICCRGVILHAD